MNHTGVVALGNIVAFLIFIRSFEKLRVGAQARFMQPPVAFLRHERPLGVIDLRVFQKLAPEIAIDTAAFDVADHAVFDGHLNARKSAGMIVGAGEHAVHFDQHGREPFFSYRWIVDFGIGKAARRLRRIEIEMALLIGTFGPNFGFFFRQRKSKVGALGIGDMNLIDPSEGFNDALFGELPDTRRETSRLCS